MGQGGALGSDGALSQSPTPVAAPAPNVGNYLLINFIVRPVGPCPFVGRSVRPSVGLLVCLS